MRHERRDAHDGVVAPIGSAIALPPRAADGVGAHAEPHAELEDAGKGAGRRHADDQALQDAEPRIDLHDAHERAGASPVMKLSASSVTAKSWSSPQRSQKSRDIAGLEAGVDGAAPVGQRDPAVPCRRQRGEARAPRPPRSPRRWCRSGHRHGSAPPTPRAASAFQHRLEQCGPRARAPRCGCTAGSRSMR